MRSRRALAEEPFFEGDLGLRSMRTSYGPFTATKINPGQSKLPGLYRCCLNCGLL